MLIKSTIFWDVTLCSPLEVNRRFGGLLTDYTALYLQSSYNSADKFRTVVSESPLIAHDQIEDRKACF
jgi:hypothetical protein